MEWNLKRFGELTTEELYQILQARVDIFVVEQQCIYKELDGCDKASYHLYASDEVGLAAYVRIMPPGTTYKELSIGRVLVVERHRRSGLGTELMTKALQFVQNELKEYVVKIQAQEYLLSFYRSFGFIPVTDVYLDEGIPHVDMILKMN